MTNIVILAFCIIMLSVIIYDKCNNQDKQIFIPEPVIGHGDFDLIVTSVQKDKLIEAIKELRTITRYDLRAVKSIIDNLPFRLMQNVGKEYAENIKVQLERHGVTVEVIESETKF